MLFLLFLAAMMEVAFPDNSRFCSEMGVKLEVGGGIHKVTKTRLFNAVVSSTLLYGAGTWTRKEQQTKRLESA